MDHSDTSSTESIPPKRKAPQPTVPGAKPSISSNVLKIGLPANRTWSGMEEPPGKGMRAALVDFEAERKAWRNEKLCLQTKLGSAEQKAIGLNVELGIAQTKIQELGKALYKYRRIEAIMKED